MKKILSNKKQKILNLIEILLKENIYNSYYINDVNRKLNKILISLITDKNNESNLYKEIYYLTDKMAILADTAIYSTTLEHINLSNHFSKEQNKLKILYDKLKEVS